MSIPEKHSHDTGSGKRGHGENKEKPVPQIQTRTVALALYTGVIALCAFPLGWDVGTTGNLVDLPFFRATFTVSSALIGLVIATLIVGCVFGCFVLSKVNLRVLGYLWVFRVAVGVYLVGSLIQSMALFWTGNLWMFLAGRFVSGISCGSLCVIGPVFISHVAGILSGKERFLAVFQVVVCVSILAGNVLFWSIQIRVERWCYVIQVLFSVVTLILLIWLPESPQHLLVTSQFTRLKPTLLKLFHEIEDDQTLHLVLQLLPRIPLQLPPDSLDISENRRKVVLCCLVMVFQQLTGINFFFYYGKIIFNSVLAGQGNLPLVLMSTFNVVGALASTYLIGVLGSKKLLLLGLAILSTLLLVFSTLGVAADPERSGYAMIAVVCMFILTFALTWGPCAGILNNQLSNDDENILSWAALTSWAINFVILTVTPPLIDLISYAVGFVFAVVTILLGAFVFQFV